LNFKIFINFKIIAFRPAVYYLRFLQLIIIVRESNFNFHILTNSTIIVFTVYLIFIHDSVTKINVDRF